MITIHDGKKLLLKAIKGFIDSGVSGVVGSIINEGFEKIFAILEDNKKLGMAFDKAFKDMKPEQQKEMKEKLYALIKTAKTQNTENFIEKLFSTLADFTDEMKIYNFFEHIAKEDTEFRELFEKLKIEIRKEILLADDVTKFKNFDHNKRFRYIVFDLKGAVPTQKDCDLIEKEILKEFKDESESVVDESLRILTVELLSVFANTLLVAFDITEKSDAPDYDRIVELKNFVVDMLKEYFGTEVADIFIYKNEYYYDGYSTSYFYSDDEDE